MNLDYAKEYLPLIAAAAAGKILQRQDRHGKWWDLTPGTTWYIGMDDHPSMYRIKPRTVAAVDGRAAA